MQKIFAACAIQDEEIQEFALHCLREISTQEYDSVQHYFEAICQVTEAASKSESSKVGAIAFEYWTTLAEEEYEREKTGASQKYIEKCKDQLITLALQGLMVINFEEDEDDDEWGHALSAACCLQKLSLLLGNQVLSLVVQFVAANIQQPSWKNKYAALMALGSITEGPDKQKFLEVIIQALQNLL